jgi:hypothetical protein
MLTFAALRRARLRNTQDIMKNKRNIFKRLKQWFICIFMFKYWLGIRKQSKDEYGDKLCYCGHTYKCSCGSPDKQCFKESVKRGSIKLFYK